MAEPAKIWHQDLNKNRSCSISTDCVYTTTGLNIEFNQVTSHELSTINSFSGCDFHKNTRLDGILYNVQTISLHDLLSKFNAPKVIDYLSIDTEGSEFDILSNFDFSQYKFKVITCEHNHTDMRKQIFDLLSLNGYKRIYDDLNLFDDWYILDSSNG